MPSNKRLKDLSPLTRALLAAGEGDQVDFKKVADGVSQDDLVAFANSEAGGQILIGVAEEAVNGAQIGVVRGCDVSDGTILQITNKAVTCIPPVSIEIIIENLGKQPILRVDIPSSATKPHCTQRGVYNRRDGARNRPLHPAELLRIFLDTEARVFAQRFEAAADRITNELSSLESSLDESIKSMANQLGWAESQMYDTESNLEEILRHVRKVDERTENITDRVRSLFKQDDRDDPVRKREIAKLAERIVKGIDARDDLLELVTAGGEIELQDNAYLSEEVKDEERASAMKLATDFVRRREDRKNYSITCKAPRDCAEEELNNFCSITAEGGEVAEGLEARVKEAFRLGFIVHKGKPVGTAALKRPKSSYRTKVFKSAKSTQPPGSFPYELGWIYLKEEHRLKGQMTRLVDQLMPLAKGAGVFATTRTANVIMQEMLVQLRFKQEGDPYPSSVRPEETIQLYLLTSQADQA